MELRERFLSDCKRRLGRGFDADAAYMPNLGYREIELELVRDGMADTVVIRGDGYTVPQGTGYLAVQAVLKSLQEEGITGNIFRWKWF